MEAILSKIEKLGVLPVIKIEDAKDAVPLAQALIDGGLPAAEVTFRTSAAEAAIRNITSAFPDMLVGAGTVLTPEQARTALNAGAKFIVSPGLNPHVVDFCLEQGVLVSPGIATPTELEAALAKQLKVLKFFPAENMGGLTYLKAMSAPYSGLRFIPTGGVNAGNILAYLKFNKVLACGGSWMVKADLISGQRFDVIKDLVKEAVQTILGFQVLNVRLQTQVDSFSTAKKLFTELMPLPVTETGKSIKISDKLEFASLDKQGEIVIGTNFLDRALDYFDRQSVGYQKVDDKQVVLTESLSGLSVVVQEV